MFLVAFSFFNQSGFGKFLMDKIILSSTNSSMEILYIWIIDDYEKFWDFWIDFAVNGLVEKSNFFSWRRFDNGDIKKFYVFFGSFLLS